MLSGWKTSAGRSLTRARAFRRLLKARGDSEHEQAILRVVMALVVLGAMGFGQIGSTAPMTAQATLVFQVVSGFTIFGVALFVAICRWPNINIPRRIVGMVADSAATTVCVYLTNEFGVAIFGVYLFITFGNGFRYGRTFLFACQVLCLFGFLGVLIESPYWELHRIAGGGLFAALVVLPLYVSTLLTRIQDARAKAEEANRAKSTFLANMSHEMRTPLNGVVGVVDLLQTTTMSPRQDELVRLLRHSVSLLRSLVDDVLDISKIEAGRLTIEIIDFDLHATLNGLVHLLRPHAQAKGLTLTAMVDPAIDYRLRGDPHHLRQVLINLLANGIKFTDRGSINVGVTLPAETDDALRLRFEVRDTGIGISEGARSRIFEQFVQADDSTTRRYGGTGLGTTIAKQLVHLMGGTIGVSSEVGVGSTFWFEVPLLKTAATRDYAAPAEQVEPSAALLVADEVSALRLQPMVAEACGRVETVNSATLVAAQLRALRQRGIAVPAVLVSGDIETACRVFETVAAERTDDTTALIYVSSIGPSDADAARLQSIAGVNFVRPDAPPRILRNAIHAATTHEARESAEIIDLGHVLKQQRQPLQILVAEDNLTNQAIIKQLLESAGHTVLLAADGEEALDIYEREQPELAILDFNMPERNGLEVVSAIRMMEPAGTRLPVIILSASVTVEARDNARSAGADDFVGKPYDAANLLQVIDRLVRRVGRSQSSSQVRPRHAPAVPVSIAPLLDELRLREVEKIASGSAFLTELLRGFCNDVEMLLQRLDTAIANGETAAIRDLTHAIRGAALSIGAQQLGARCVPIDDAAAGRQLDQLKNQAADLRACYDKTVAQISAYAMQKHRVSL